jgi:hypothetical protein
MPDACATASGVTSEEILQRARALAPRFAERADAAEQARADSAAIDQGHVRGVAKIPQ